MQAALPAAIALLVYFLGYLIYSRFLAEKVFQLRGDVKTPAVEFEDGVDFVPSRPFVLFGHHYASIAGLAPMLGPAVAVVWGWLPAMVWVVLGAIFVGCVHDFGSLVVSMRARGQSIGVVAEGIMGKRAKSLMHCIIFFLVSLAMGVFVFVIAFLFSPATTPDQAHIHFPQAVIPSFGLMLIACVMGLMVYKRGGQWKIYGTIGFLLTLGLVYLAGNEAVVSASGLKNPDLAPDVKGWSKVLLIYAFLASVLPVWLLLQPRDLLNSLLLYLGLSGLYAGFFFLNPEFAAPAVRTEVDGAPSLIPFVFIVIACGAASGFHSLVSSGTTSKQIANEKDARAIGYGGMIGESLLGLIAVLATTAGITSTQSWDHIYANWASVQSLGAKVGVFINGGATFLESLGIEREIGASFISIIVVSYALTSLDSATRLLRYNFEEMGASIGLKLMKNRVFSSLCAVGAIGFFAFYEVGGKPAGLALWKLFGTTNQLLAGLALLIITLYLLQRGKPWLYTGIPMLFLMGSTIFAMVTNVRGFQAQGDWILFAVGTILLVLAVWLLVEAFICVRKVKNSGSRLDDLSVFTGSHH